MKVGIVGANGQVGTELCFLFRERGDEVVPIVRSPLAAGTFDAAGFEYAIADPAAEPPAVFGELDVLVVAAFAPYLSRSQFRPKQARQENEHIVRGAVEGARDDATVIYLSSIAAFGGAVRSNSRWWFTREKRHVEEVFSRAVSDAGTAGYNLRIGHVFGPNQSIAERFRDRLTGREAVVVRARPDRPSNVVHTPTIRSAIETCVRGNAAPGTYTVVDRPQWTWREVVERYAPGDLDLQFDPVDGEARSLLRAALSRGARAVPLPDEELLTVARLLPDRLGTWLYHTERRRRTGSDLESFGQTFEFHTHEFDYQPVPGPFLPDSSVSTSQIVEAERTVATALEPYRPSVVVPGTEEQPTVDGPERRG